MDSDQPSPLRDFTAAVIAAVACPLAVFGGSTVGCVGHGFSSDCMVESGFISQVLLLCAGVAARLVTRGWTGLLLVWIGVVVGMTVILLVTFGIGRPVPLDPISGVIAAIFFLAPVTAGYGLGRLVSRVLRLGERDGNRGDGTGR